MMNEDIKTDIDCGEEIVEILGELLFDLDTIIADYNKGDG